MRTEVKRHKVGELRPSQVLTTYGVGSIIDLPHLSVMVMGLDDWPFKDTVEIGELRLLASVQEVLGAQMRSLRSAPIAPDSGDGDKYDASSQIGIPVAPFPRWMVCPYCHRLAPIGDDLFKLETPYRIDQIRYVHTSCNKPGKKPTVIPARFIVACKNGHLDDFPWRYFVHRGPSSCKKGLKLNELGASGEASEVQVECACGVTRRMSDAFKLGTDALPLCRGRRPHLRDHEEDGCKGPDGQDTKMTAMLQGASNSWFALSLSALALPYGTNELTQLIDDHWMILEKAKDQSGIELLLQVHRDLRDLTEYSAEDVWKAVQSRKNKNAEDEDGRGFTDLKRPEWEVFSNPSSAQQSRDFQLREVPAPTQYAKYFERIVLAEKLREVRALIGFTRIESPADYDNPAAFPEIQRAKLSRNEPTWVPASEIRGEGIFIQFRESVLKEWMTRNKLREQEFFEAHCLWRKSRGLVPADEFWPGLRYILLHSFAHTLIRELGVECGYTTASIRERIYSTEPGDDKPPMAGVLIYTAAPDSEGTLGGLVSLGNPGPLGRHLDQALDQVRFCASDPLCAEHHPHKDGITLHGASCHACLFTPETSCERGNKYLDRSVLVETVDESKYAFFGQVS